MSWSKDRRYDMLKTGIQQIAHLLGYHISKITRDQFTAMHDLCGSNPKPIIFDVGAYEGGLARIFREYLPNATIYAFEPFSESFARLKENTANDPGIKVFNLGFSDSKEEKPFHSNSFAQTNSLLESDPRADNVWGQGLFATQRVVNAQFTTVDAFIAEMHIPKIDILKLDVQGAEHLVMKGAKDVCGAGKVDLIYTEIITQPTYQSQLSLDESLHDFWSYGFELYNFYDLSVTTNGRLRQMDALFIRR